MIEEVEKGRKEKEATARSLNLNLPEFVQEERHCSITKRRNILTVIKTEVIDENFSGLSLLRVKWDKKTDGSNLDLVLPYCVTWLNCLTFLSLRHFFCVCLFVLGAVEYRPLLFHGK